ncbi:MAG: NAD(P)/FAD-dependent oxidoreductase [Tessaracoccus sp.]|uniref:type III sulfide quinone reductase, selenoprotein subtype n=1 Tax=Tessaracoccus sp. TaxID=1971211 RepID=UPI001EB0D30C|nr:FAD/NAD(P)-binding oxidoreductase [Tessaracoccus sp.]MBK7822384.1 NAD(P)/FAD-dependent oxidoreductase [Tessaracoccus sp.]
MTALLILGAGTAGTTLANLLAKRPELDGAEITVVDRSDRHDYQPGYLFVPFGMMPAGRVSKDRRRYLPKRVNFVQDDVATIDRTNHLVRTASGRELAWDQLIVTTGTTPRPDVIPGMADGALWRRRVFDFYTLDGAKALRPALAAMKRGRLVVHISEMPIKCPVAPIEFALLAQDYLRRRGLHPSVDVVLVTPLDGAFTRPVASRRLGRLLGERGIELVTDFQIEHIDNDAAELVSYDGRRAPFDLCVTIPPNRGADYLAESGLADELGFVRVDKHTLQSTDDPDVWAAGDATNVPTSKAGSVAHFMTDALVPNIVAHLEGRPLPERFDGHANCFIESGRGQAMLLDFNYDVEPLPGRFPIYRVPALRLLGASRANHLAKLGFEAVYWEMLIRGRPLPFAPHLSMEGKEVPDGVELPDGYAPARRRRLIPRRTPS